MKTIDLAGPEGNAFALMGTAKRWARQMEWPRGQIEQLRADMRSGNYTHVLACLETAFPYLGIQFANDPRTEQETDHD